jgi:hypothetical protein
MLNLLTWALVIYGTTVILVYAKVFDWLRYTLIACHSGEYITPIWLQKTTKHVMSILICPLCTSFWVGVFFGLCHVGPFRCPLLAGLAAAGLMQLLMNTTHANKPAPKI